MVGSAPKSMPTARSKHRILVIEDEAMISARHMRGAPSARGCAWSGGLFNDSALLAQALPLACKASFRKFHSVIRQY
jgi:hypothetical protein